VKRFRDRAEAGQQLARRLLEYAASDVMVLALPRGGVPVAFEIAKALHAPLEVFLVRKLGVPGQEELAMGAVASGGVRVLNEDIVQSLGIANEAIERVAAKESAELERRERVYRGHRPFPELKGKTVICVDDGIATGATMRAAVTALRQAHPATLMVAAPTSARDTYEQLQREADKVVCLATPEPYIAVGLWYEQFPQTSDEEVKRLLSEASSFIAKAN
jgi:putative phosphoribosyl transferase